MSSWGEIALKIALNNDQITIIGELPEKTGKRNKFNAVAVVFDGIRFDSKAEMKYYGHLRELELLKQISGLEVHPTLELYAGVKYRADFRYIDDGQTVIVDVKGGKATQTPTFKMKWKQAKEKYPDYRFVIVEAK